MLPNPRIIEEEGEDQDVGLGLIKKAFDFLTAAHPWGVAHRPLDWLESDDIRDYGITVTVH